MKKIIDLHHHLDTLSGVIQLRSKLQNHLIKFEDHIKEDTQTIISIPVYVQAWHKYEDIVSMVKSIKKKVDSFGERVRLITKKADLEGEYNLGILIHVESARLIKTPQYQLPQLFELGVRGIIPLHFVDNHLGNSCDDPKRRFKIAKEDHGLTDAGVKFIERMNELQMWVDVSHTTDKTADDMLELGKEVMASHIAIRDLNNQDRNKKLEFFQRLAKKGGVFGLIPWQHLVGDEEDRYNKHIQAALDAGLKHALCLGTDLGAPIKTHPSIKGIYDCAKIADQFKAEAELIKWENAYHFLQRALPN